MNESQNAATATTATDRRRAANRERMAALRENPEYRIAENQRRKEQRGAVESTAEQKAAAVARTQAWRKQRKAEMAANNRIAAEQVEKTSTTAMQGWASAQPSKHKQRNKQRKNRRKDQRKARRKNR